MASENEQPAQTETRGGSQPPATPSGEPASVRNAYDALPDKSGRKRGGR